MMAGRRITGEIEWASKAERPSAFGISPRASGVRLKGLQYERAVGRALGPGWQHGLWFKFCDEGGVGYCQPDFIRVLPTTVVVLECKLTDVMEAKGQLLGLYLPVMRHLYSRPARGIIVAKHLTPGSTRVVDSLEAALADSGLPTLFWPWPPKPVGKRGTIHGMNVGPAL